jgi:predicted phage-related endonuclease
MKTLKFDTQEEWLEARKCKITGSRLKDIIVKRGTGMKIGYYELIAERIALPATAESAMDRGHRLEEEAILKFEKETGKQVNKDLVIWVRDDNDSIAISPDGYIGDTEAVEVKCLSSARHIQAFFEKIPSEYEEQVIQYFIVNEKLEKLYFCFYDPRLQVKDFFYFEVTREEKQDKIQEYLDYQVNILDAVNTIVAEWTF